MNELFLVNMAFFAKNYNSVQDRFGEWWPGLPALTHAIDSDLRPPMSFVLLTFCLCLLQTEVHSATTNDCHACSGETAKHNGAEFQWRIPRPQQKQICHHHLSTPCEQIRGLNAASVLCAPHSAHLSVYPALTHLIQPTSQSAKHPCHSWTSRTKTRKHSTIFSKCMKNISKVKRTI